MARRLVFPLVLALYLATLCPTISVGDSGELVAAAFDLGIPHPTGYPLYLLSVKAFGSLFGFLSFAHAANLFSAVCAAAAAQVFAGTVKRVTGSNGVAIAAALILASVEPIWSQAVVARTYPLALLGSAVMLDMLARWWQQPDPRWWWKHNLVLGFALANHPMVLAHIPAVLVAIAMHRPSSLRSVRALGLAVAALLPGLATYSYLPVRAAAEPTLDYRVLLPQEDGRRAFVTLDEPVGLKAYLLREHHHGNRWVESAGDYGTIVVHHLATSARELLWVGALLAVWGAVVCWRTRRRMWVVVAATLWLFNLAPLAWHGAWWDIFLYPRYMTISWLGVVLLAAAGLAHLLERAMGATSSESGAALRRLGGQVGVLVLPAILMVTNWHRCDRSDDTLADDYARALFDELPQGAQFGAQSDNSVFPMMYLQIVEGVRPDVRVLNEVTSKDGKPDFTQPMWSPDAINPYPSYGPPRRRGLMYAFSGELTPPELDQEWTPPDFSAMGDATPPDPIGISVVAQLHADIAEAHFVRGQRNEARERLERVATYPAGRPWGAWRGAQVASALLMEAAWAGDLLTAREDLARLRALADAAHEHGDARDATTGLFLEWGTAYEDVLEAFEQRGAGDAVGALEPLGRAMKVLRHETALQQLYLRGLRAEGREQDARDHEAFLREPPSP